MPGTFAHITLVSSINSSERLAPINEIPKFVKMALGAQSNFCELGAVSPDYPYLVLRDKNAAGWANVMHYWETADFLRRGVRILCDEKDMGSPDAQKRIAWLFGYASHVVADLTIHPVIEQIVGPYAANKREHRVCELHQDAYIFHKILELDITTDEYLRDSGIRDCGENLGDTHHLDSSVRQLWVDILCQVRRDEVSMPDNVQKPMAAPNPDKWHHSYVTAIDDIAEEGRNFLLVRGLLERQGCLFPSCDEVLPRYTTELKLPGGGKANYDAVFERAAQNILDVWRQLGVSITQRAPDQFTLANANLDTGKADGALPDDPPLFWRV